MRRTAHVGPSPAEHPSLTRALADPWVSEIVLAPGRYVEQVVIAPRPGPLMIRSSTGRAEEVVLSFGLRQGDRDRTGMPYVQDCATLTLDADAVTLEALTVENSFDKGTAQDLPDSQAIALRTRGTDILVRRCRLLGRQDTVLLDAPSWAAVRRVQLQDCEIVGDVDFLYGRATALIEGGEIRSLGPGVVTAPSTARENPRGFLLQGVRFTAVRGVPEGSVHLGRPWHPGGKPDAIGQAIISQCHLGAHIASPPWCEMGGFAWQDARFAEVGNTGPGAHGRGVQLTQGPDPRTWLEVPEPVPGSAPRVHLVSGGLGPRHVGLAEWAGWAGETEPHHAVLHHDLPWAELVGAVGAVGAVEVEALDRFLKSLRPGDVAVLDLGSTGDPAAVFTRIPSALRRLLVGVRARGTSPVLVAPVEAAPGSGEGLAQAVGSLAHEEGVELIDSADDLRRVSQRLPGSAPH